MQPIDVDIVGLEPAQRRFALLHERLAAGAAAVWIALEQAATEFCADHDAIPAPLLLREEVTDDLFGMAVGVDVGGVDEIAAALQIGGDHRLGVRDAGAPSKILAKGHAPETKRAHAKSGTTKRDEGIERHIDLLRM
jgi:hypothetical protein